MTETKTLDLPIFSERASLAAQAAVQERYRLLQSRHEAKKRKQSLLKYLKIGGAMALTAAGLAWYEGTTATHTSNVTETVRPHERVWNVVARAETDAGVNLNSVDITPVVDQVKARYGDDIRPNQKIVVPVEQP